MLQPISRKFLRELDAPGGNNLQYIYYSVLAFQFLHSLVTRVCTMKSCWEAMGGALESYVRGPLIQCMDDSEHLFVMDLIVPFHWRQEFAVEGHWVLFLLSGQLLRENGSRSKVRAVSLDAKGLRALR